LLAWLRSGDLRSRLTRHADLGLALLVALCVGMMIVPLPTFALDLLITLNIAIAVVLLLVSIHVSDALKIATFPSLLLLSTLFRLALEISATRLILLKANAGTVIAAFGGFVVAGNLIVGVIVFFILTVIQYVVIAKGAARVAEVSARFTLDAMPGKQLSIDADLRAGHITAEEAREHRASLSRESQFFGSMDGAMRFVKGDAVAGIIILVVNIVGGLLIGLLQRGMPLASAVRTYTLLTIGEGLVAQIPALVISTAAGILVTRVSSEDKHGDLGGDIGRQILAQPKALAMAAALLSVLALVPGLPGLPFLVLAAVLGLLAWRLLDARSAGSQPEESSPSSRMPLRVPLELELSADLARELAPAKGPSRLRDELLPAIRDRLFAELGIPIPAISVCVPVGDAAPRSYGLRLHEIPLMRSTVKARTATETGAEEDAHAADVIAEQVYGTLRRHGHRLIGIQETQNLLDSLERTQPAVVREVVPKLVTPVFLSEVLQRLVKEGISLRNLADVLTALAKRGPGPGDPEDAVERVRAALQRQLTFQHGSRDGSVVVYSVDATIEDAVREAVRTTNDGAHLALPPAMAEDIVAAVRRAIAGTQQPIILTNADIRRHLRALLESEHPEVAVLAYQELLPEAKLLTLGCINLEGLGSSPQT